MKTAGSLRGLALLLTILWAAQAAAQLAAPDRELSRAGGGSAPWPEIRRLSKTTFAMGRITIDTRERSISFPAALNQDQGIVEYLLVHKRGKVHESLLVTDVEPYDLQVAFLLLDYHGSGRPLKFQGDPAPPQGEAVTIAIVPGEAERPSAVHRPEEWLVKKGRDGQALPAGRLSWVFTGSREAGGRLTAQVEGSIIAVYHDPAAILDNADDGGEAGSLWFVREGPPFPAGTAVTVTIAPGK